jgi:membrane protein implicated in regulation of membrane protease activity
MVHARLVRMQPPTSNRDARSDDPVPALGTIALVSGIVEDARDLVAAHVEALRDDMSARLATLGATLGLMLIAVGVFVVTGLVLCLAIAASLAALGAPWWLALWIVTLAAAAIGVGFVFRARTRARATKQSVEDAAARARREVTKIGDATAALFISPSPERRPT